MNEKNVATFANEINSFFARFEQYDCSADPTELMVGIRNRRDEQIVIMEGAVVRGLKCARVNNAIGPNGEPARALKGCAKQGKCLRYPSRLKSKPLPKFHSLNILTILHLLRSRLIS